MEQMINIGLTFVVIPFIVGLAVNFVYSKIKNHSSTTNRKSGLDIELNIKLKFNKK
ncbi:hypothetical protein [Romboutsia sp.]|uniref:hypothetical protein n=1 Tax=Romboutsia sp. TaxID=1965302 RepID=UPI003F3F5BD7